MRSRRFNPKCVARFVNSMGVRTGLLAAVLLVATTFTAPVLLAQTNKTTTRVAPPPGPRLAQNQQNQPANAAGTEVAPGSALSAAGQGPAGIGGMEGVTTVNGGGEADLGGNTIFSRALQGGPIVFMCLLILCMMSVATWAIVIAKYVYMMRITKTTDGFIKSFWDSRSLNDLNSRLGEHPYSPVREVFRSGYAELVRGSQLRDQAATSEIAVQAAMDNLHRALSKSKLFERRRMEKFLSVLSISASASPFIGLFGTVWGIMRAFEGIARTGSASLAAVAPGISEALIATAFGLAAAIPAVIGYNIFASRIRGQLASIDGFVADFLNIVERYLVTDKSSKGGHGANPGATVGSPLADRI